MGTEIMKVHSTWSRHLQEGSPKGGRWKEKKEKKKQGPKLISDIGIKIR